MGAGGSIVLLNPAFIDPALGWRLAFLIGTTIGLIILVMRRWIPESPRWLMTHGFVNEADAVVRGIEAHFAGEPRAGARADGAAANARSHSASPRSQASCSTLTASAPWSASR